MSSVISKRTNDPKNTRTVLLNTGTAELKREEIRDYLHNTFQLEEQLYEVLKNDEAFYLHAEALRHPLVFYMVIRLPSSSTN